MIPLHICSMCIKTHQVGKQEVGIWRVQKCFPQYGILTCIWSLWPNIRFLPSIVAEKNILGRTDVKQYYPLSGGAGGIKIYQFVFFLFNFLQQKKHVSTILSKSLISTREWTYIRPKKNKCVSNCVSSKLGTVGRDFFFETYKYAPSSKISEFCRSIFFGIIFFRAGRSETHILFWPKQDFHI